MKNKLLYLDTMITPQIITFIYWILLLSSIGAGLFTMFGGFGGFSFSKFLTGIFTMIAGAVAVRIWCELLIVIFKIHENLKKVATNKEE